VEERDFTIKTTLDQFFNDAKEIVDGFSKLCERIRKLEVNQNIHSSKIDNLSSKFDNLTWIVHIYFAINIIMLAYIGYFK